MGYSPWGRKEANTTGRLHFHFLRYSYNRNTIHSFYCTYSLHCACLCEGFPDSSAGKESTCNEGDPSLVSGSGRSTEEGIGYSLPHSGLESFVDCTVHGVAKSWVRLSD